jgi:anti-anti-sigma factor
MEHAVTPRVINLHGALTVDRAVALKEEISAVLAQTDQVFVNLSQTEDIDLACLQVFYAARRSARAADKQFRLVGSVTPRVAKRLSACGFLRGSPERAEDFETALIDF